MALVALVAEDVWNFVLPREEVTFSESVSVPGVLIVKAADLTVISAHKHTQSHLF